MVLAIYLLGIIPGYYSMRYQLRSIHGGSDIPWEWSDVLICAMVSIFSWALVFWALIFLIIDEGVEFVNNSETKPPKWL